MTDEPRTPDDAASVPEEDEEVARVASALEAGGPVPSLSFRAALRRHLLDRALGRHGAEPARVRLLIAAYAGSGLALLAIAMIGVVGAGPFAAG